MASPEAAAILRELQQQRDNGVRMRPPPPRVSIALFSVHERYAGRSRAIEAPLIGRAPPGARAGIPDRSKGGGSRPLLRDSFFFSAAASRQTPRGYRFFARRALRARLGLTPPLLVPPRRSARTATRRTPSGPPCRTASSCASSAPGSTAGWACTSPSCARWGWIPGPPRSSRRCAPAATPTMPRRLKMFEPIVATFRSTTATSTASSCDDSGAVFLVAATRSAADMLKNIAVVVGVVESSSWATTSTDTDGSLMAATVER